MTGTLLTGVVSILGLWAALATLWPKVFLPQSGSKMTSFISKPGTIWALPGLALVLLIAYYFWTLQGYLEHLDKQLLAAYETPSSTEIERRLAQWIKEFGWTSRHVDDDKNHFHFLITTQKSSIDLDVMNPKKHPKYVEISTQIITKEAMERLKLRVSEVDRRIFMSRLTEKLLALPSNLEFDMT